jgi:putative DNA methylase
LWVAGVLFWGGFLGRFIESPLFPIGDVNEFSAGEKRGGGRPDFWEMVFWWTRKPLIGARSVIAGALLLDNYSLYDFKRLVRLSSDIKTPHRENPRIPPQLKEYFSKVKLLDPFAGFGSIPLEAARLNLGEVVAVELLPTAYIFLKAVLEYPKLFGERLIKDVERWGKWITDRLQEDPDIKELYDEDVAVYIGTWEIKCPHCGRYTPLIGNWWLARVAGKAEESEEEGEEEEEGAKSGVFSRLAWMTPYTSSGLVGIRIIDLNKELNREEISAKVNAKQGTVEVSGRTYNVPKPNIDARRETATCLLCNNIIKNTDKNKEWYVKEALKEYNNSLERYLRGEITLENLLESKAKPRILVKVKAIKGELEFEPATNEDNEKIWKALEKLRQIWGDPDIPTEEVAPYQMGTAGAFRITLWGFDKFYKLFNLRQLLTLVKLVKLIREVGKQIEQEKIKEGLSKEGAFKYAEAVTTYLAIALVNHTRHNCLTTSIEPTQKFIAHALAFRGIAMTWNWIEEVPTVDVLGSFTRSLRSISEGLSYLVSAVSGSPSKVRILLGDATDLSKLAGESFNLTVTDPPYRDDVPYAELSDFYYVWLKRTLSDVKEVFGVLKLTPRFHEEAFFDEFGNEVETQWKAFALREISENEGRIRYFGEKTDALDYFKSLLSKSFNAMASRLKDDGLLVTYYAHTSPDAWEALLEAGWLNTKMRITAAHAIATESAESVTARGKVRLDMAIVAVWRKGTLGEALLDDVYAKAVEECSKNAQEYRKVGLEGVNLFVAVLGKVLSQFTQYERLIGLKISSRGQVKELVEKYIYPATAEAIARSYGAVGARLSPTSMFYLLAKTLVGRRPRQARRVLDRTTAIILSIGTRSDLEKLRSQRIILRDGEGHSLLEPRWGMRSLRDSIEDTLTARNLNPREPSIATAIDTLHLLEYYAVTMPKEEFKRRADEIRGKVPALFDEAVALIRILASGLPAEDPERELTKQVMEGLGISTPGTLDLLVGR